MSADVPIPHPFAPAMPGGAFCAECLSYPSDPTFTDHHAMPEPAEDMCRDCGQAHAEPRACEPAPPFVDPPSFTDAEAAAAFDAAILPAHLAAKRSGL